MDADIASLLGGIICHSGDQQCFGGQQCFVDLQSFVDLHSFVVLMRRTPVDNAVHCPAHTARTLFRTPSRAAPHTVLVRTTELLAQHPGILA